MSAIRSCALGLFSGVHATSLRNITHRNIEPRNLLAAGYWPLRRRGRSDADTFFPAVQRLGLCHIPAVWWCWSLTPH